MKIEIATGAAKQNLLFVLVTDSFRHQPSDRVVTLPNLEAGFPEGIGYPRNNWGPRKPALRLPWDKYRERDEGNVGLLFLIHNLISSCLNRGVVLSSSDQ